MKVLIIKADGEFIRTEFSPHTVGNQINHHVGGLFTCVGVGNADDMVMYVHDEGLLLDLPTNYVACVLTGQVIAGDVVIIGENENGESIDIPEFMLTDETERRLQKFVHPSWSGMIENIRSKMDFTPKVMSFESFDEYISGKVK